MKANADKKALALPDYYGKNLNIIQMIRMDHIISPVFLTLNVQRHMAHVATITIFIDLEETMESNFEELITNAFFQKQIKDRIFYELCSKNKRKYVIKKLSHTSLNYIDSKCIVKTNKMLISPNEILGFLKNNSQNNECYCISDNKDYDGIFTDVTRGQY